MGGKKDLTKDQIKVIVSLHKAERPFEEIARIVGVTRRCVQKWVVSFTVGWRVETAATPLELANMRGAAVTDALSDTLPGLRAPGAPTAYYTEWCSGWCELSYPKDWMLALHQVPLFPAAPPRPHH
ncbi:hypothetical protein GWK47_045494 [Chionoecetes opilio]|uniref:Uncharacterized protein n=1 Tax=Chionoecetes opilio TaxID=41210 RepID=A0A8J4Y849_CHIOP|nr:hypothetical protein GWK47_045494 [Chionoecetes opilio]